MLQVIVLVICFAFTLVKCQTFGDYQGGYYGDLSDDEPQVKNNIFYLSRQFHETLDVLASMETRSSDATATVGHVVHVHTEAGSAVTRHGRCTTVV